MKNMEVQTEDVNDECYTEDDIWKCYILVIKGVRTKKVDDRNQKGSTKYIILQIFSPSNAQKDSKFVFENSSNPLRLYRGLLAWFFIKNHAKYPLYEGRCYDHKGF